ncbi:hypothetical protein [Phycobacter sp. K97]|uniref:hypothetical protein n=1 Tax=Phycobacter sedimenti TaxID=3133977 RepID=UPI00311EB87F
MDWHTRKVLAWRFSNRLATDFCVEELNEAIFTFSLPETGLESKAGVGKWIAFYTRKRPHFALGGKSPAVVYLLRND